MTDKPKFRIVPYGTSSWAIEKLEPGSVSIRKDIVLVKPATFFSAATYKTVERDLGEPDRWITMYVNAKDSKHGLQRRFIDYEYFDDDCDEDRPVWVSSWNSKETCKRLIDRYLEDFAKEEIKLAKAQLHAKTPPEYYP